ncbi:hypothetical protein BDV59DRAFT_25724 [Aspergillus ambiguus]|uniref:uncharacterized protein n=1 Tax=Aspergillus ambiguus TaxID=176160 RepID=UPI003CCCEC3B
MIRVFAPFISTPNSSFLHLNYHFFTSPFCIILCIIFLPVDPCPGVRERGVWPLLVTRHPLYRSCPSVLPFLFACLNRSSGGSTSSCIVPDSCHHSTPSVFQQYQGTA